MLGRYFESLAVLVKTPKGDGSLTRLHSLAWISTDWREIKMFGDVILTLKFLNDNFFLHFTRHRLYSILVFFSTTRSSKYPLLFFLIFLWFLPESRLDCLIPSTCDIFHLVFVCKVLYFNKKKSSVVKRNKKKTWGLVVYCYRPWSSSLPNSCLLKFQIKWNCYLKW